ncbi:MAG: A24 family peptidase [Eubacteriales bacterium]
MNEILLVKSILIFITLGLALYYDIYQQKIKNQITLPAAILGAGINLFDKGMDGLLYSLKGWLVPIIILIAFYYINVMGAGDIKLFAAVGAIMGLPFAFYSFVFSIYIGGLMALVVLIRKKELLKRMDRLYNYLKYTFLVCTVSAYGNKDEKNNKFIFAAAIVPGTLLQLILTIWKQGGQAY